MAHLQEVRDLGRGRSHWIAQGPAGMPVSWDWQNWYKGMWNAEDHRLFPPKRVGIGWTLNFREVLRRLRVAK